MLVDTRGKCRHLHFGLDNRFFPLARTKRIMFRTLNFFTSLGLSIATMAAYSAPLTTFAEHSGFQKTGRYDEVIRLCEDFQKTYPASVRCIEFGRTPEGRPMKALVISESGSLNARAAHQRRLPVMLIQGGIHAGEIDGKDAGFIALRAALQGKLAKNILKKQVVIFIPVFNVDGHERFGRWNRPNQRGPEEMGWRTTAQNFNLNRDYAKADTTEMQAMLRLVNEWDPLVYVDLHVTNGAKFEHDISIQVEPLNAGDDELRQAGRALRESVIGDLRRAGSLPLPFYPEFLVHDDPSSGFADSVAPPRFSTGYFWLRNRFGILVETHSWKNYATRVRSTRNTIISLLSQVARNGADWIKITQRADVRAAQIGGQIQPLAYSASDKVRTVDFRGYEYTRTYSEVSGSLMTRYDESRPQLWKLPLRDDLQPSLQSIAPKSGYLVPAAHADWIGEKLKQHGIEFSVLSAAQTDAEVETFRADTVAFGKQSVEGQQRIELQGSWKSDQREIRAGSLFVPIAQAKSRLVMALLEPQAPDSLAAWGKFNNAFEQKEYMEDYVAEEVARAQLKSNPELTDEFSKKLAADAEFAKSPQARLQFFARRHSSWDDDFNLYPVLRTAIHPVSE